MCALHQTIAAKNERGGTHITKSIPISVPTVIGLHPKCQFQDALAAQKPTTPAN